ncbi:MAG: shikimate kinase [Candidatus Nanopelagicales bacterium]
MNIVLIGMRGVGKTNIARRVGFITKRPVMSTDVLLEYDTGLSIPDFVEQRGWQAFREAEYQVLRKVTALHGMIIDAGGGIVVDLDGDTEVYSRRKVHLLRTGSTIVFLKGDIERLAAKVHGDATRPTLHTSRSTIELMRDRLPFYERAADVVIDVENRPRREIAEEIARRYR